MIKRLSISLLKYGLKTLLCIGIGAVSVLVIGLVLYLQSQPELDVWHKAYLDEEFTRQSGVRNFTEYLALEERLFKQLDERVNSRISSLQRVQINRFYHGSLSDPGRWPVNWNHSYELGTEQPRAGVLLIHGLSDSPYSLRNLGQDLHKRGAWVVGLRLPGHGTAPSGLVRMQWQDMHAAVELAMRHLRQKVGTQPIYIIGYSTGGALGMYYSLLALNDASLPRAARLVMISPAIGVTDIAALAKWQARLGRLLGIDKLAWNSIQPEYDPFKYGSFAVNAGEQVYLLTVAVQSQLDKYTFEELKQLPPVLAFESVADNTVSAPAVIQGLFARLPENGNELILFDINRNADVEFLLKRDPAIKVKAVLQSSENTFAINLLTNESPESNKIVILNRKAGGTEVDFKETDLIWPRQIFSLAHVALPFPPSDPLYGGESAEKSPGVHLGNIALRGESSVIQVSASEMLRQRWNPFYSLMVKRIRNFIRLAP